MLAVCLEERGFRLGWTPTHLLAVDLQVPHEECSAAPVDVVTQILNRLEAAADDSDGTSKVFRSDGTSTVGLPGFEFTIGGQHISERSG